MNILNCILLIILGVFLIGTGVLILLLFFPIAKVEGDSMLPTYEDGQLLVTSRFYRLKVGDVYVFTRLRDDGEEVHVIKRLTQIDKDISVLLFFEGDNAKCSYDSRNYGYVSKDQVVSKVLFKINKKKK